MDPAYCEAVTGSPSERLARLTQLARAWSSTPLVERTARRCGDVLVALATVQLLPYRADPDGAADLVCDPATILRRGGDCEDRATLLVALLLALRRTARLVWIEQPHDALDHVSVQLWDGAGWQWCDPIVRGARVGEHPVEAARRTGFDLTTGVTSARG